MSDISKVVNSTSVSESIGDGKFNNEPSSAQSSPQSTTSSGEKNRTDPKVCHDPSLTLEGIAKIYSNQNKVEMEDRELSSNNIFEMTSVDGIEYPLVVINDRNIENNEIISLNIDYTTFLPKITLHVYDKHEDEQKMNTSQMSGLIRTCIISNVDKVYKKILLNFRIYDVKINDYDPTDVTYYGIFYVPLFRQINTKHIWMQTVCPCQPNCGQGGHINANTWEMLHKIAQLSGLGFAATKKCKEIEDRVIRNIYSQRYDQYIEQQLLHCGTDEENIFDAWVDFYGYIVMVNVPWVMNEQVTADDYNIIANVGINGSTNDTPKQEPQEVPRTLTNYNLLNMPSNMEIESYSMEVDNNSIKHGTLEKVYSINFKTNMAMYDVTDVQSKQDSVDGDFIEDYNTGKNRPIPKFNFNDDAWTGLSGGYDLHKQKIIRNAYFRKKRQSILNVTLKNPNLGLQRGTIVNIAIYDNDPINKRRVLTDINNVGMANEDPEADKPALPPEMNQKDLIMDDGIYLPNLKLSGLYYIDGMNFNYERDNKQIVQTLFLIKKGKTSGYENKHTTPKLDSDYIEVHSTLPQSEPFLLENEI